MLDTQKKTASIQEQRVRLQYPVLIISRDCPFCPPAKNLWSMIADEAGIELNVLVSERDANVIQQYRISGVPCLLTGPDKKYYGMHFSHSRAKEILTAGERQSH